MTRPKHFSTIILKKPGMIVPRDVLTLAMKENPSCCGYAIQAVDEENRPMLYAEKYSILPDISKIDTLQNEAKDFWMTLFLSKFDGKFDKDLVQPFTLFGGEEDDPHLAIFLEGDFPALSNAGDINSDESNLAHNIIIPKLQQINRLTKGDMQALREEMETEQFNNELLRETGHRGMFVFMMQEGDPLCFGKNELGGEFEWGATSNLHQYTEIKEQEPKAEEPKVVSSKRRFGLNMDKTSAPTQEKMPEGVHKVPDKKVETPAPEAKTDDKVEGQGGYYWTPPAGLTGRHLKRAIRKMLGLRGNEDLPKGWSAAGAKFWVNDPSKTEGPSSPIIQNKFSEPVKDLKDIGKVIQMKTPATETKVIEPKTTDVAPAITDSERSKAQEYILKHLDGKSNVIPSMEDMSKAEEKWASFSQKVTPLENTFRWPADKTWAFFQNNPKAAFIMWLEYRRSLYSFLSKEPDKKPVEPKGTETKTSVPDTPAAPVAEQKKPKGRFGISAFKAA